MDTKKQINNLNTRETNTKMLRQSPVRRVGVVTSAISIKDKNNLINGFK